MFVAGPVAHARELEEERRGKSGHSQPAQQLSTTDIPRAQVIRQTFPRSAILNGVDRVASQPAEREQTRDRRQVCVRLTLYLLGYRRCANIHQGLDQRHQER